MLEIYVDLILYTRFNCDPLLHEWKKLAAIGCHSSVNVRTTSTASESASICRWREIGQENYSRRRLESAADTIKLN